MALLHEQLYQSDNLAQIDFAHYVQRLVRHIVDSHDAPTRNITFTIDIAQVNLRMDTVNVNLQINYWFAQARSHPPREAFSTMRHRKLIWLKNLQNREFGQHYRMRLH
jgi:hypothetical protein